MENLVEKLNELEKLEQEIKEGHAELQKKAMLYKAKQQEYFGLSDGETVSISSVVRLVTKIIQSK